MWKLPLLGMMETLSAASCLPGNAQVAILTHSFGGTVLHHFMHWVEKVAGRGWVEKRVALVAGIGVPHLGVPKALSALLSGEPSVWPADQFIGLRRVR